MTFRKMVNHHTPPPQTLATKIESGVQLFGALKSAWDVGKTIVDAGRVVAPYVARGIALL